MKRIVFLALAAIIIYVLAFQSEKPVNALSLESINSQSNSPLTYNPPLEISVRLWHLDTYGNRSEPQTECSFGDDAYGCVATSGYGYYYPYDTIPALVSVENDYLLDVVPREMYPHFYQPTALTAQAVASRSYAYYWNNEGWTLGNSTNYQVFVPYTFEQFPVFNTPNNNSAPCQSTNLNSYQQIVCNAVSQRRYLSYSNDEPAQTEFSSDAYGVTVEGTGEASAYLLSVQDPISTACDSDGLSHGRGMSQEGASRWARGHQCSYDGAPIYGGNPPGDTWSLRWNNYEQILFHYYSNLHLRDTTSGNPILSPQYRWNPLSVTTSGQCPSIMHRGQSCTFHFVVQNTGTTTWYYWQPIYLWYHGWEQTGYSGQEATTLPQTVQPGETVNLDITITPPWYLLPGASYQLRFEMGMEMPPDYVWEGFSTIEPTRPWFTYNVSTCIDSCKISLPLIMNSSTSQ